MASLSLRIDTRLLNTLRDIAYEDRTTLTALCRQALVDLVASLERKRGASYPKRTGELPRGPRITR